MDLNSNSYSYEDFGPSFSSRSSHVSEYNSKYVSFSENCPMGIYGSHHRTMKTLVLCNDQLYVCSDTEVMNLDTAQKGDKQVPILRSNSRTKDYPRQQSRYIITGHTENNYSPCTSSCARYRDSQEKFDPRLSHTIVQDVSRTRSDYSIIPIPSEKELRSKTYSKRTKPRLVTHYTNTARHRKPQKSNSPENNNLIKSKHNEESDIDKGREVKREKQYAEKWTYCRPVFNLYNREIRFQNVDKVSRLQEIVKQLAEAREREKEKIAWDNYINKLKQKYTSLKNGTNPESPTTNWGGNAELIEDYYNTRFVNSQSERCKDLLRDVFGNNTLRIIEPTYLDKIKDYDEDRKGNGTMNNDNNIAPTNSLNKPSCFPMYLLKKTLKSCDDNNMAGTSRQHFVPYVHQQKLVSNKSMCFPTSSLAMLKSEIAKQNVISQNGVVNTDMTIPHYSSGFQTHVSTSVENLTENNRVLMSPRKLNNYCHSTDVNTFIHTRNYLNDHTSPRPDMKLQNNERITERESSGRVKRISTPILKTCDAILNTDTITPRYYLGGSHHGLQHREREPMSILKNKHCDGGMNTDIVMPFYNNYMLYETTPLVTETICYPTCSQALRNNRFDWNESVENLHGTKKYDRQRPRITIKKTKSMTRKVKQRIRSATTQTERMIYFENSTKRYREDPITPEGSSEYGRDYDVREKILSDRNESLIAVRRESLSKDVQEEKVTRQSGLRRDKVDLKPMITRSLSREETNSIDSRTSFKDKYDKYSVSLKKRQSRDERTGAEIERIIKSNQPSAISETAKYIKDTSKSSVSGKAGADQNPITQQTMHPPPVASQAVQQSQLIPFLSPPSLVQPSLVNIKSEQPLMMTPGITQTRISSQYLVPQVPAKPENKPHDLKQYSEQSNVEKKSKSKEEYEKVAENVARLKSRNKEHSNSGFYKGLEGKLDLLISAINALVLEMKNRNNDGQLDNLQRIIQTTCCKDCIAHIFPEEIRNGSRRGLKGIENEDRNDILPKLGFNKTCKSKECITRNELNSVKNDNIYSDPASDVEEGSSRQSVGCNRTHTVNRLCFERDDRPLQSSYLASTRDQSIQRDAEKNAPINVYCKASNRNRKIEQILQEEMGKSDQAKKDIEDILNGEFKSQALQIAVEIPTKERSTEVTDSLSKAKIIPSDSETLDGGIIYTTVSTVPGRMRCTHLDNQRRFNKNERTVAIPEHRNMAVTLEMINLGLWALLRVSGQTIGRLLNYMQCQYNECRSLLPSPTQYMCNLCTAAFRRSSDYTEHMQREHREHRDASFKDCCVCRHLLQLQNARGRAGLFTCRHCGQVFTRSYCCELHQQTCSRRLNARSSAIDSLSILR